MKNVFFKYLSALLAVWYCLSIIGFDVHSCNTTGNIFVNSVLSGTSCDEVHPEHDCEGHGSCCCSHKCCDNDKADEGCCTNEIEVLDSESVLYAEDDLCDLFCCAVDFSYFVNDFTQLLDSEAAYVLCYPDPGERPLPDLQAVLNIWRI
jgi:hypothetical protein